MERVFIGCPTYNGLADANSLASVFCFGTQRPYIWERGTCSLLALNNNILWCHALQQRRENGVKWFAMLHADIVPKATYWLDTLIEELEAHDADVMSAVVPIKDPRGLTSTAIDNPRDPWEIHCRLTTKQVNHPEFPKTFDILGAVAGLLSLPEPLKVDAPVSTLLVNTGCFVCRIDKPWAEAVRFHIEDRIIPLGDGAFKAQVQPEDWLFSRQVASLGGRVFATTKVPLTHRGNADFDSDETWGADHDRLLPAAE